MRLGDLDRLAKDIELAVEDAPLHVQATVQQYIDCSSTIDPIRVAGGCRCGECKYWADTDDDGHGLGVCENSPGWNCHRNDFCSYGEPREAQDDG